MGYDVYGVGNAIMDIQVRCEDSFLQEHGLEKGMMTLVDESQQQAVLDALGSHELHYCSGGSAANTVVAVADMGGSSSYACKTGPDAYGRQYLEEMQRLGISVKVSPATKGASGTCVVLITPDAQRTMLTCLGVSSSLSVDDINGDEIAQAKYVYIEGYLFAGDSTRAAALKAIDLAVHHSVKVALTISDPFLIDFCRDEFLRLIKGPVDLLFCNEDEAKALTGKSDPIDCARAMHQDCASVAMTLGKNGSIIMQGGDVISIESVAVEAIDTTGAGDMYAGGVLYGITNGLGWKKSGQLGSHSAARIVSQLGARLPESFSMDEVMQLID